MFPRRTRRPTPTRYTVIENFKESVPKHDYSIVLQHDTNAFSVDAVEEILSWGIKNGYSFRALDLTSPGGASFCSQLGGRRT